MRNSMTRARCFPGQFGVMILMTLLLLSSLSTQCSAFIVLTTSNKARPAIQTQRSMLSEDFTLINDVFSRSADFSDTTSYFPSLTTSLLQSAHGHTQPLWGPPDPYLSAGKSIAPSAQALANNLGITKSDASIAAAALPDYAQKAASNGWNILDPARIHAQNLLPGFSPTGGILPAHNPNIPAETPATFMAQIEWSAKFLNVVDNLPAVAFAYALVEFFLIRPNLDMYKEDIEEEPSEVLTETVSVTGVRLAVFAIIAVVTTTFSF